MRGAQRVRDVCGLLRRARQQRHPRDGDVVPHTWHAGAGSRRRAPVPDRTDGADLLGHGRRHRAQLGSLTPGDAEHQLVRAELAEPVAVDHGPAHQRGRSAAKRLDGAVRVGEQRDPGAVVGQHAQEPRGRRGALLMVVHHDQSPPGPGLTGDLVLPRRERLARLVDHDGRIEPGPGVGGRLAQQRHVEVFAVQVGRGHPLTTPGLPPEPGQIGGGQPTLRGAHQQVAQLVAERPQAEHVRGHGGRPVERDAVARRMSRE